MPSGWDVYYIVFLAAALSLCVPIVLAVVSRVVSTGQKKSESTEGIALPESRTSLGSKMNTRFFLAANAAVLLITLALILVPCVGTLQRGNDVGQLLRGLASIVTIASFATLGLFYSAKKGDLSWLRSFNEKSEGRKAP